MKKIKKKIIGTEETNQTNNTESIEMAKTDV